MNYKILFLFLISFFSLQLISSETDERAIRKELEFLYKNGSLTAHQLMQNHMSLHAILDRDIEIMQKHKDHLQLKTDTAKNFYKLSIISFLSKGTMLGLAGLSAFLCIGGAIPVAINLKMQWDYFRKMKTAFHDMCIKNQSNYLEDEVILKMINNPSQRKFLYDEAGDYIVKKRNVLRALEYYVKADIREEEKIFLEEAPLLFGLTVSSIIFGFCSLKIHTYLKKYLVGIDSSLEKWHNHIEQDNAIIIELKNIKNSIGYITIQ